MVSNVCRNAHGSALARIWPTPPGRQRDATPAAPYFLAGRKLYAVGTLSGAIEPIGAEHLVGEMGGVWAHLDRVLADGIALSLADAEGAPLAGELRAVTERLAHRVAPGCGRPGAAPARVCGRRSGPRWLCWCRRTTLAPNRAGELRASAWLKLLGCWFGGQAWLGGGEFWHEAASCAGLRRLWQGRWGLAFGASAAPARCEFEPHPAGALATLSYPFQLGPGESAE